MWVIRIQSQDPEGAPAQKILMATHALNCNLLFITERKWTVKFNFGNKQHSSTQLEKVGSSDPAAAVYAKK